MVIDRSAVFLSTKFLVAIIACFILAFSVLFVTRFPYPPGWDFRNNLWAPAFLLIRGQSPYNVSILYEQGSALWTPVAIGFFWLIGYLPLQQASNLWWMINLISLIAIVWLSTGYKHPPKLPFTITLVMVFIYPPTISHFTLGQITIFICFIFLLIANYESKFHPFLLAVMISLTLTKPQLTIFTLPGYFFAYTRENGFRRALQLAFYLFLVIGIICLPLFISHPQWVPDFIRNVMGNPSWAHPSSLFILQLAFNKIGYALWWLLLLAGSSINLWLWVNLQKKEAMIWSLALTTLITPYVWSWDFVLLIPMVIRSLNHERYRYSTWLQYVAIVSCWGIIAYMKLTGQTSDDFFWWVPWYLVGFILINNSLVWSFIKPRLKTTIISKIPNFLFGDD